MNSPSWSTEVAGLHYVPGSFAEEKGVLTDGFLFRFSTFLEIERQEDTPAIPRRLASSLAVDEFKLGQVVDRLTRQDIDHVLPKSFSILEKRGVHEK